MVQSVSRTPRTLEKQETKLIEYLIDTLTALSLNTHIYANIQKHLLMCLSKVANCMKADPEFARSEPFLIDSAIFIHLRLLVPFMITKIDLSDPVLRKKLQAQRMTKNLRDLVSMSSTQVNV